MTSLGRFFFSCIVLSIVIWFCVSVPVGKYTLWGHAVRIARTDEARDLTDGAKKTARDAAQRMKKELDDSTLAPPKQPATPPAQN